MVVVLDVHQLRILAESLLESDFQRWLFSLLGSGDLLRHESSESYLTASLVLRLLRYGDRLGHEFQDNAKAPIADEIFSYLQMGVNFALQGLRNYQRWYLTKIMHVADSMMMCLSTLDSADVEALEQLKEVPIAFKHFMLEQLEIMQLNRLQIALSPAFSVLLHEKGLTFQQLVEEYVNKLWEFQGEPFKSLSDNDKIQVYKWIIEASGHGTLCLENLISRDLGPAETELLLFTVGMTAWDIFSSHGVADAALANLIRRGAARDASLRQALGVADGKELTDSALCVVMAGILNGAKLNGRDDAVVIGTFADRFFETFITSGGRLKIDNTDPHYYVDQTPDCVALARGIADRH